MIQANANPESNVTPGQMTHMLNADLASELKGIVAFIVYSQIMKRGGCPDVARELELHAAEDLQHAKVIVDQIESLGGTPCVRLSTVSFPDEPMVMPPSGFVQNHAPQIDMASLLGIGVSPTVPLAPEDSWKPSQAPGNPPGIGSGWSNQRQAKRNSAKPVARKKRSSRMMNQA